VPARLTLPDIGARRHLYALEMLLKIYCICATTSTSLRALRGPDIGLHCQSLRMMHVPITIARLTLIAD
jgi:hypothetical protein